MTARRARLKQGVLAGIKEGWRGFIWIGQIALPVSLLVTLLHWTGWLNYLDFLLNPLMSLLNLPPEAALPIITGMLISPYTGIGIITVIPFTPPQMLLIAIFTMTAHSLITEGIIQHKSGLNAVKATLIRIAAAALTVLVVSWFLGDTRQSVTLSAGLTVQPPFLEVLWGWVLEMVNLLLKILVIIMFIMILLESLKSLGWIEYLLRFFSPLVQAIGLSRRTAMMWVTANIFGLLYGSAVIAEEVKKTNFSKGELERLHIFIGIHHSVVEDPALFAALGLNLFWLLLPRFVIAVLAVQAYRLWETLRRYGGIRLAQVDRQQ